KQRRRLVMDPLHISVLVEPVVKASGLLADLARADLHHRSGQDRHHLGGPGARGQPVGLGVVEVADDDRGLIADAGGNSGAAATGPKTSTSELFAPPRSVPPPPRSSHRKGWTRSR